MDTGSRDIISNLPEALICHILSFLSTKDAALTSVLSKRWRHLLAFVPNLDLDNIIYDHRQMTSPRSRQMHQSFQVFVDRILALQGNAWVNKFSLSCEIGCDPSSLSTWIFNVLERGVVELDLSISLHYGYPLPWKVLMSKTLVRLKVVGADSTGVGEFFLPKLKTLYLRDVAFEDSGAAFSKLISACHVLEELVIIDLIWDSWDFCSVSNTTLKRLEFWCDYNNEGNPNSVSFDTPNLVYLGFTDTVALKYPKLNFDSLLEARLDLRTTLYQNERAGDSANATDLFLGICNVEILYLSAATLEVLTVCCKVIPVFNNVIHLTIETNPKVEWESLPNLLENSPNLETLVFDGLHYKDTNQCLYESYYFKDTPTCLSSSPVKILKVLKFGEIYDYEDYMDKQVEVIKYLLKTMPNLEQVILYYNTPFIEDVSILSSGLQMLEEVASPKCKIKVISDNISFSFNVHSSSSTSGLVFFKNRFPV